MSDNVTKTIRELVSFVRSSGSVMDVTAIAAHLKTLHPSIGLTELGDRVFNEVVGYGVNARWDRPYNPSERSAARAATVASDELPIDLNER